MGVITDKPRIDPNGLKKFSLGRIVNLAIVRDYTDPSLYKTFEKALAEMEGRPKKELTKNQIALANMIIHEANEVLCEAVLNGTLQDVTVTNHLFQAAEVYSHRTSQSTRDSVREARRIRFKALAEIAGKCSEKLSE